jgi:hypothetical protein
MKIKILLLLGLVAFSFQANAFTIVIQGGTKKNKYDYIESSSTHLICRGSGPNFCPVSYQAAFEKGVEIRISDVTDYVALQIEKGEKEGGTMFREVLPIKWTALDDGMQVEIESENVQMLKND